MSYFAIIRYRNFAIKMYATRTIGITERCGFDRSADYIDAPFYVIDERCRYIPFLHL